MTTPGLVLDRLEVRLRHIALVGPISLSVPPGIVVTLTGPSGAGKSTLLAAIAGSLDRDLVALGSVHLDGRELLALPAEKRRVGILFQDDLLFPHLSLAENLEFAVPRAHTRLRRTELVKEALAEAGLGGRGGDDPAVLSGGERARAALMRALLAEPLALLLDEPFARLDPALRARIRAFVFDEVRSHGLPTLLVTHDPEDATAAGGPVLDILPGRARS